MAVTHSMLFNSVGTHWSWCIYKTSPSQHTQCLSYIILCFCITVYNIPSISSISRCAKAVCCNAKCSMCASLRLTAACAVNLRISERQLETMPPGKIRLHLKNQREQKRNRNDGNSTWRGRGPSRRCFAPYSLIKSRKRVLWRSCTVCA